MKTASDKLKEKNGIEVASQATGSISQPGPEDGRDQNIRPGSSHTYEPKSGEEKRTNHNEEVYREGEEINQYPKK